MPNSILTAAEIAARLRLNGRNGTWRGTCPVCDYKNAFSLRETTTRPLMYCACGCTQDELRRLLCPDTCFDGRAIKRAQKLREEESRREVAIAEAAKIWHASENTVGTVANTYLARRGLPELAISNALRFSFGCRHPTAKGHHLALVAAVVDVTGKLTAVHRTYLTSAGQKTDLVPNKASKGPIACGAIRLDAAAPEIVIGEGIETSASAGILLGLPAWAAVSAGNLAWTLILPPEVRSVVIAADADEPGEKAAQAAKARWLGEGRDARIARPTAIGGDFNDVLVALRSSRSAP